MSTQIIITAFLLGFAGISIFLQIFSIAAKNNLSMKPYFIGKILQGCFAAFYTFIIISNFSFLQFDIIWAKKLIEGQLGTGQSGTVLNCPYSLY